MAHATFHAAAPAGAKPGLAAALDRRIHDLRLWFRYRRTVAALSALPDRTLADHGWSRGGLRALAREAVYGPAG